MGLLGQSAAWATPGSKANGRASARAAEAKALRRCNTGWSGEREKQVGAMGVSEMGKWVSQVKPAQAIVGSRLPSVTRMRDKPWRLNAVCG